LHVDLLQEAATGPLNILKGLRHLLGLDNPPKKVLVLTTDLPFVSAEILNAFFDLCPADRDICVPLISKVQWERRFPDSTATFARLSDGYWTLGGAYLIDVQALENAMPQVERVFVNRKSVLGMAKLLGPKFLFKFLVKSLNVPDVEAKIESMLNCTGRAVPDAPTELAYDIDDVEDYEYALKQFAI
jgi:hypothetical protein